ncbi:DGQHR domain-containing protein [Yersinia ruckeri]|uniref:DGQHR domain-containing protein n=1 Tax=Yersinia ruckeri TaxID=29486 RepID=UPI0020BD7F68|nr:DGQHR domain-containing protein [Yersinia ruckeri]UZY16920.1 DGQHR domain-containing protein [Yersinia ruckeri]
MNNSDSGFNYRFPACELTQGERQQYIASVPFKVLKKLFPISHEDNALKRSQRVLNKKHASDISNYVYGAVFRDKPYILPTIVASIDGECNFEPSLEFNSLGMLNIPMDTEISCFDGQHRISGIIDAISRINVLDSISVLFVSNTTIALRQQFFSDINSNAVKPSKSLCMAYDRKTENERLVYSLYESLDRPAFIDLDHNTVPANSNKTISYKQFYDATRLMFDGKLTTIDTKDFIGYGRSYWKHWFQAMSYEHNWQTNSTVEYRKESIGYHGIFVTGWAMAIARLRQQKEFAPYQVTAQMGQFWLDYGADHYSREEWKGICINADTGRVELRSENKIAIADRYFSAVMKRLTDNIPV